MNQEEYLKKIFGDEPFITKKAKKTPTKKEIDRDRVKEALKRAHEIRQFEIRLYWERSLFFWGFVIALFTGFFFLASTEYGAFIYENELLFRMLLFILCCLGLLVSFAWLYIHKGSIAWQKNWEYHIDFLEDAITGKLHKSAIGKGSDFFSPNKIHKTVIHASIIVWMVLVISTVYQLYSQIISYFNIESPYSAWVFFLLLLEIVAIIYLIYRYLVTSWRTSEETIPGKNHCPNKLRLFLRGFPKATFIESPGNTKP